MDLLCSIAYDRVNGDSRRELQDNLDMMVRKQVLSSIAAYVYAYNFIHECNFFKKKQFNFSFTSVKNRGIIGICRIIGHTVWATQPNENETNVSFIAVDDLPEGKGRTAAKYIGIFLHLICSIFFIAICTELIITATYSSPEMMGLCYDELSAIVSRRNPQHAQLHLDGDFISWLSDRITNDFQDNFITDCLSAAGDTDTIELECQHQLNAIEEIMSNESGGGDAAINIAGTVLAVNRSDDVVLFGSYFSNLNLSIAQCSIINDNFGATV